MKQFNHLITCALALVLLSPACQKQENAEPFPGPSNSIQQALGDYTISIYQYNDPSLLGNPLAEEKNISGFEAVLGPANQLSFRLDGEELSHTVETVATEDGFAFHIANDSLVLSNNSVVYLQGLEAFEINGTAYDGYFSRLSQELKFAYSLQPDYGYNLLVAERK